MSIDSEVLESRLDETELPDRLREKVRNAVEKENIDENQLDMIIRQVWKRYRDTRIDPLEPVGTVSAQSIGEPGTQLTMNTFHYAGVAEIDVTQGLPRLIEIVDARKEPDTPMMTIYLKDEWATEREKAREVVWEIESTTILSLGDISINVAEMKVNIKLDAEMLDERNLEVDDIASQIQSKLGVEVEPSGNVVSFGPENRSYRELLQLVEELREIVFKGIEGINRVVIRKEDVGDREEYVLYTEGSAFRKVLKVDGVDETRSYTNNIHEIESVLGIEAARKAIMNEMVSVLQEQGLEVDIRHIMLVADAMTVTGEIRSIGRHGISGSKDSVLSRAAFEVTVNHLLDAAVHGEIDDLNGVAENVIVGQPIKLGTGDVDLVMGRPQEIQTATSEEKEAEEEE